VALAIGWVFVAAPDVGFLKGLPAALPAPLALLAGLRSPVIGFAVPDIWEAGSFGLLAAFSTIMCLVGLIVAGTMMLAVRAGRRRQGEPAPEEHFGWEAAPPAAEYPIIKFMDNNFDGPMSRRRPRHGGDGVLRPWGPVWCGRGRRRPKGL
jgi:hypothetical protein